MSIDKLGLSDSDIDELNENIDVLFHCAASIRFADKLKLIVNTNTTGTLRVLKLAEKMKKLQAFCYVSTAFVHCYNTLLEERYQPSYLNPLEIIKCTQFGSESELDDLEKKL